MSSPGPGVLVEELNVLVGEAHGDEKHSETREAKGAKTPARRDGRAETLVCPTLVNDDVGGGTDSINDGAFTFLNYTQIPGVGCGGWKGDQPGRHILSSRPSRSSFLVWRR